MVASRATARSRVHSWSEGCKGASLSVLSQIALSTAWTTSSGQCFMTDEVHVIGLDAGIADDAVGAAGF